MAEHAPLLSQDFIRLKECRHGPMLYNAGDMYIGRSLDLYGEFSEEEIRFFGQFLQPGMMAIDVGANIGSHTVFMAKKVGPTGHVVAIEPQRVIHQMLCANVALNALQNVHNLHAAVGREEGSLSVPNIDYSLAGNFGSVRLGGEGAGEQVRLTTIDGLGLPRCHLIKIDVEGMEDDALAGAEQTLKTHQPALYVENEHQDKSPAVIERLLGLGYRLYWHLAPLFNADNFFGETENVFSDIVSMNVIGLPASAPQNVSGLTEITDPGDWFGPIRRST